MEEAREVIPNLTAIRQRRGVPLRKIADATGIRLYYLRAIERGEMHKLPGGVYARSYVRQYARAIDYDEQELVERCGLVDPQLAAVAREIERGAEPGPIARLFAHLFHALGAEGVRRTG